MSISLTHNLKLYSANTLMCCNSYDLPQGGDLTSKMGH